MISVLPIALSITALIFSVYVFFNSRVRDRRDVLMKMSEMFISDDLEKGRYLLFNKVTDKASVDHLDDQEYHNINRALSAFNLLGLYVKNGYISEKEAIETWGWSVYRSWVAAQPFLEHREQGHGYRPWPYFDLLAEKTRETLSRSGNPPEYKVVHRSPGNKSRTAN